MREREYLRRQVKALSAEGRLSAWILGGLPPVFLAYLALLQPDYLDPMIGSPLGWLMFGRLRRDDGRRRLLDEQDGQGGGVVMGATLVLTVGMVGIFTALFVSLAAIGVFTNETRGVSKSLAVVEAFTTAPKSMQDELQPSFNDRVLVPLLNRFVGLGKKLTPADHGERIGTGSTWPGNPQAGGPSTG